MRDVDSKPGIFVSKVRILDSRLIVIDSEVCRFDSDLSICDSDGIDKATLGIEPAAKNTGMISATVGIAGYEQLVTRLKPQRSPSCAKLKVGCVQSPANCQHFKMTCG